MNSTSDFAQIRRGPLKVVEAAVQRRPVGLGRREHRRVEAVAEGAPPRGESGPMGRRSPAELRLGRLIFHTEAVRDFCRSSQILHSSFEFFAKQIVTRKNSLDTAENKPSKIW